jgi:hypothetical protein
MLMGVSGELMGRTMKASRSSQVHTKITTFNGRSPGYGKI